MKARTAAEQQIEALRQLKQAAPRRKAVPPPALKPAPPASPATPIGFELSDAPAALTAKKKGPNLPLSPAQWRRLRERQREHQEFKRRRDMGDWAAELLLALPPQAHRLGEEARAELFRKMREWAEARGLR